MTLKVSNIPQTYYIKRTLRRLAAHKAKLAADADAVSIAMSSTVHGGRGVGGAAVGTIVGMYVGTAVGIAVGTAVGGGRVSGANVVRGGGGT